MKVFNKEINETKVYQNYLIGDIYSVDLYLENKKYIIEINGEIHDNKCTKKLGFGES